MNAYSRLFSICSLALLAVTAASCCPPHGRCIRTAEDITPGHYRYTKMDWRYGAADIRLQMNNATRVVMDRWYWKTGYLYDDNVKPRIVITTIDNRTDQYIAVDMMRDIMESVAVNDGRFTMIVGDTKDEKELDSWLKKLRSDPKYNNNTHTKTGQASAPQFLGKLRLTKALTSDARYDYEEYRLTITLYDVETQELVDSAWDVLQKRVTR